MWSQKKHILLQASISYFICHHLKLCARKHLWQHPECRPCLALLTPSVKMSPCVWISRPDTERSHHPPECSHTGNLNSHSRQPRADYISAFKPRMMDRRGNSPLRRQVEGPQILTGAGGLFEVICGAVSPANTNEDGGAVVRGSRFFISGSPQSSDKTKIKVHAAHHHVHFLPPRSLQSDTTRVQIAHICQTPWVIMQRLII